MHSQLHPDPHLSARKTFIKFLNQSIYLFGVGMERAVVVVVQNTVSISIRVTRVTKLGIGLATPLDLSGYPISIRVLLTSIRNGWTVVLIVPPSIAIGVIVTSVSKSVAVRILLTRVWHGCTIVLSRYFPLLGFCTF